MKPTDLKCFPSVSTRYLVFALRQLELVQDLGGGEAGRRRRETDQKRQQWNGPDIIMVKRASPSSLMLKEAETRTNRWILQENDLMK